MVNDSMLYCHRALSSFDGLDFGAVKQSLDSTQMSVAGINVAEIGSCAELFSGRLWLSATDALQVADHKLLQTVTIMHVDDDSDNARFVCHLTRVL